MRTLALAFFMCTTVACKWTEFDDLKEEAWVNATTPPDNGSSNWGLSIQRSVRSSPTGGRLTVLGSGASVYNEIAYAANGGASIAPNEQKLDVLGVANLDAHPILIADPNTDDVALVKSVGVEQVLVLRGTNGQFTQHNVFGPASTEVTGTYIVAPDDITGGAAPQPAQPLVGAGDILAGTLYSPPTPAFQPQCQLFDGDPATAPPTVQVRALGAFRPTGQMTDDVVVWGGNGKLYVLPGGVFNGSRAAVVCPDALASDLVGEINVSLAAVPKQLDTQFMPGIGSQILPVRDGFVILQGHNDQDASFLALVDLKTTPPMLVGTSQATSGILEAAIYDDGTNLAVVAGYPLDQVDGVPAGRVAVHRINLTTGVEATPLVTLFDAEPEKNQSYGRTVAVIELNGSPVIAVGASNEVFLHFRVGLDPELYPETRQR